MCAYSVGDGWLIETIERSVDTGRKKEKERGRESEALLAAANQIDYSGNRSNILSVGVSALRLEEHVRDGAEARAAGNCDAFDSPQSSTTCGLLIIETTLPKLPLPHTARARPLVRTTAQDQPLTLLFCPAGQFVTLHTKRRFLYSTYH